MTACGLTPPPATHHPIGAVQSRMAPSRTALHGRSRVRLCHGAKLTLEIGAPVRQRQQSPHLDRTTHVKLAEAKRSLRVTCRHQRSSPFGRTSFSCGHDPTASCPRQRRVVAWLPVPARCRVLHLGAAVTTVAARTGIAFCGRGSGCQVWSAFGSGVGCSGWQCAR